MTLKAHIMAQIQADGPMRLDTYMQICLLHPTLGYYTSRAPFGQQGDFITAPEISQMFGELLGLSLAQAWLDQGRPTPFTLAELGPGRGTLMADVLRATASVPGLHDAARLSLLEASPALRKQQAEVLAGSEVTFIQDTADLPDQALFLIANEFFDALPVRQFIRTGAHWRERLMGIERDALSFGASPAQPRPELEARLADTKEGDLVETRAAAVPVMDDISTRIHHHGGAALIIDYGDWRSLGDTFQALQGHALADPLAEPGQADLTAHVDFEALAGLAACRYTRVTPQGVFLERLGITARAQSLAAGLSGDALDAHIAAHRRLTHPDEMGNLFKVMGLYREGDAPPPGLEP